MACLRESPSEGRRGTLHCDEEGCDFAYIAVDRTNPNSPREIKGDCVLQLRLRAGDAEEPLTEERIRQIVREEIGNSMFERDKRAMCRHWVLVPAHPHTLYYNEKRCFSCGTVFRDGELPFERSIDQYNWSEVYQLWEFKRRSTRPRWSAEGWEHKCPAYGHGLLILPRSSERCSDCGVERPSTRSDSDV